jgi:hypothetical protein
MATFTKVMLSGSTNGKAIKITATASTGNTIHTVTAGTVALEEVWLYAVNSSTAQTLTLEWGGVTTNDTISINISKNAVPTCIAQGLLLNNGLAIKAFAPTAGTIMIFGYAHRIV